MIVRKTTPEEARRINELFAICFEFPYSNCPIGDPEQDPDTHWAAFSEDGNMMSNFTIPDYTVNFDGHSCKMAGIGGVATLPQYRRMGGIRACFDAALPDMYESGYAFSYLYPFSTRFYRQFGYESCVQKYGWEVNLGLLDPPKVPVTFRLCEKNCPQTEAIRSVDQIWERYFNMMVQHREEDYKWTTEFDPAVKQEFTYVCYDQANVPKAYTTFKALWQEGKRNIVCSRFCFGDRDGFAGLMMLFKSLSADHNLAKFQTPALPSLQYLMPEWSLGAVKWEVLANSGMVRAINVRQVLEKAAYLGSGQVTLEIRDPQIPQNNGRFTVAFSHGKAVSVSKTEEAPDALLSIGAFSALICGVWDLREARHTLRGLEILGENPSLDQVFYRKPMMIVDFF